MQAVFVDRMQPVNPIVGLSTFDFDANAEKGAFAPQAKRGEYYTFQLVVQADAALQDVRIHCVETSADKAISDFTAFHQEGTNAQGEYYQKITPMAKDERRVFWCGFFVREAACAGIYPVTVQLYNAAQPLARLTFSLSVSEEQAENHGFNDIYNHSRLCWLNSDIGIDDTITKPYTPIVRGGQQRNELSFLGRKLSVGRSGLPQQLTSFFAHDNSVLDETAPKYLFAAPPRFQVGEPEQPARQTLTFQKSTGASVAWQGKTEYSHYLLQIDGTLEYEGFFRCVVQVLPKENFTADSALEFRFATEMAQYMIGLGCAGGKRPERYDWHWDIERQQDTVFLGAVNAGMQLQLKDALYHKPPVNIYYHNNPLHVPPCWHNEGKGGIALVEETNAVLLRAYTGEKSFVKGQPCEYRFECLFTPLKPIDWHARWGTRYFHRNSMENQFDKLPAAQTELANVVNVHHGADAHPFINYPFFEAERMRALVKEAHAQGLKLKPYYTARELTHRIPEIFPFLTLDDEIYPGYTGKTKGVPLQGENDPWITKNLTDTRVITAWKTEVQSGEHKGEICASILTNCQSRFANFYLEGLDWMLKNYDIDGIYVDDTSLDRTAYRRIRKILDAHKDGCLIDFHSWNHFEDSMGAGFACNINLYLALFPYMDSIWFGERFDYLGQPDYWLSTIAGVMYGVPGELIDLPSVNNYKGLIYGMTNRPYSDEAKSPTPLWRFLLGWEIEHATLLGYWDDSNPFSTNCADVPVSAYKNGSKMLLVVTNFAQEARDVTLLYPKELRGAQFEVPEIETYQTAQAFSTNLHLEPHAGLLISVVLEA